MLIIALLGLKLNSKVIPNFTEKLPTNQKGKINSKNGCRIGFCLDENGICQDSSKNQFCLECKSNQKCSKCKDGYGFDQTNENPSLCIQCPDHCSLCSTNAQLCEKCEQGYTYQYVLSEENGKCVKSTINILNNDKSANILESVNIQNCLTYNDDHSRCVRCSSPYGVNAAGQCANCITNCVDCSTDSTNCTSCAKGYGVNRDSDTVTCTACLDLNCTSCDFNYRECIKCDDHFTLKKRNDGRVVCVKCLDPNCVDCSGNESFCIACEDGFNINRTDDGRSICIPADGDTKEKKSGGLKPGVIAAIVIVCIVVLAIIIFLLIYCLVCKKRKEAKAPTPIENSDSDWDIRPANF